jgi:Ribbon-helix-helix protein, copG family
MKMPTGGKPTMPNVLYLRVDDDMMDGIDYIHQTLGCTSQSEAVRILIAFALKNWVGPTMRSENGATNEGSKSNAA